MATQSHLEKEQKQRHGEEPTGPKKEVFAAPGDSSGTSKADTGPSESTVSSDPSVSGEAALRGGATGASFCVMADAGPVSTTGEDPGPSSKPCMRENRCPELQDGPSPHTELSYVGAEGRQGLQTTHLGSEAEAGQTKRGGVQASGRPTHTTGCTKGCGRKWRSRKTAAQAHKLPRHCLFSEAPASQSSMSLLPSYPKAEPSSRRRAPRASQGSLASQLGPDLRGSPTPQPSGPVLRSRTTLRGPTLQPCASEPGPAFRLRSTSASAAASARSPAPSSGRLPAPPRCAVQNQASGSGTSFHSPGYARGRAHRRHISPPGPARRRSCAPSPVPDPQRGASAPGSTRRRRRASRPRDRLGCSAPGPNTASRSRATGPGPALRRQASGSSPAFRSRSSPISSAQSSGSTTAGFVSRSSNIQSGSTQSTHPALPEPAGQQPPSPGLSSESLVLPSSSSSPDTGAPNLPSQPRWHAVRMRASSPSPPGRLYPFPGWFVENPTSSSSPCPSPPSSSLCTSSSGFPDQGPSSPPAIVSGHSPSSSSPTFDDLVSISNLSPPSLRRALLLEFDALSPASPGEGAEIESMRDSPTPPPGEL